MTEKQEQDYIGKIWTDPGHPTTFAGTQKVYQIVRREGKYKIGRGTIKKIVSKEEA